MADVTRDAPRPASELQPVPPPRAPRRLPAPLRLLLAAVLGAAVAALASYLMRSIGF